MTKMFPAGLLALSVSLIIALPAHAQNPPTTKEKGRMPVGDELNGPPPPMAPPPPPVHIAPEKKTLIKELLGLMNATGNSEAVANRFMDQLQPTVVSQLSNGMREWIQAQKFPPAEQKRLEAQVDETIQRILTRVRAEVPKRISFAELLEKLGVEIYNRHFTEAELKDLIVFYKTSTAQKFTRLLPQIIAEVMPGIEKRLDAEPAQLITELIEKAMLKTYGKYFTEAEVKDLIAFYNTSTAQKFTRIQPQFIAELTSGARKLIVPEVVPLISEIVDAEIMKLTQKQN